MRIYLVSIIILSVGLSSCNQAGQTITITTTTTTNSGNEISATLTEQEKVGEKIYSVDDFVENGFREQKKTQIKIGSVTCYNDFCGVEGKKWGINLNKEDSKQFYPYSSGTGVNMIISAEPDNCENKVIQCHTIKNASIIKIEW